MKKALEATQKTYESSSEKTPEYLEWYRLFKKEFVLFLGRLGATNIQINKPNHFGMGGNFTLGDQMWYFRIEDIRWSKDQMLIRTVKTYRDFVGGANQYASLRLGSEMFMEKFTTIVTRDMMVMA